MIRSIWNRAWLILSAIYPVVSFADTPPFAADHPILLAVTVTDSEDSRYGDYHATWYVYEAVVDKVVAGEFSEDTIRYAVFQPPLAPSSPAQFILIIDLGNEELEDLLATKYHGLGGPEREEVACFSIDPAEVFPENARFDETVSGEFPYTFMGAYFDSEALLAETANQ